MEKQSYQSSSMMVSIGAPSFGGGQSFDTLDFSLPSYSEANGGSDAPAAAAKSAPSFSAGFPDLKLPRGEEAQKDTAADEALAKKSAEDERAAKNQVSFSWTSCGVYAVLQFLLQLCLTFRL